MRRGRPAGPNQHGSAPGPRFSGSFRPKSAGGHARELTEDRPRSRVSGVDRPHVGNTESESLFGSLKSELVHRTSFLTREAARRAIFGYVEASYDRRRRHSALG